MGLESGQDMKPFEMELLESLIENSLLDEALSFLERMIEKYQDNNLVFKKSKVLYLQGQFNEAIEELTSIIAEDTDHWETYELLGEIYRIQNQPDVSENYYFKATSLNPRAIQSWLGRGKLALQRGEYQVAVLSFETFLRIKREDTSVWQLLAQSYKEMENYLSAIDAYNSAIEIEPVNQELYEELGDLYEHMGRADIAKEKYLQALQVEEKTREVNRSLYNKLSRLFLKDGDIQKTFNMCNELLTLVKDDDEALFLSGQALVRMGQRYEGIVRIKRAIKIADKSEYRDYLSKLD
ncbi:MAG: tetratricopeptide repeat protein, partial [Candidatus Heimdallarchaeaceae archaeon]